MAPNLQLDFKIKLSIVAMIASLFPDLDHPQSFISRGNWAILSTITTSVTEHRGATHTLLGAFVFTFGAAIGFIVFNTNLIYILAFLFGYMTHLFADLLTITEIKLFYPFSNKKYGLGIIRTGSNAEFWLQRLLIAGVVVILWHSVAR
jgi:inner membrane protein